jgi:GT2 family glycosyltransferase
VSNDRRASAASRPQRLCRIGELAYLVAGPWTDTDQKVLGRETTRRLDFRVHRRTFSAVLLKSRVDLADAGGCQSAGLLEFAVHLDLNASERGELIAIVFRLVAQVFNLRGDGVLKDVFTHLLSADGIPRGRMIVHGVDHIDTAICEASRRFRLGQGSLIVSFAGQLATGDVRAVESPIGRRSDTRLAVAHVANPLSGDRMLLISSHGISVADVEVRQSRDIRAFGQSHALQLPEALNLLAIWDGVARSALAALGKDEAVAASVALPPFGFRFEITHTFSMKNGLFISGWFVDPDRQLKEVWLVDYGLADQCLLGQWVVTPAKVAMESELIAVRQFHAFAPRQDGYAEPPSMTFKIELRNGEGHIAHVASTRSDDRMMRDRILGSINQAGLTLDALTKALLPAVQPIQAALNDRQRVNETLDLGIRSTRAISIVIPLQRELRFIRSQLIAFDADPLVKSICQIVYVVDDPLVARQVRRILDGAVHVFALDIRLVQLERSGGDALANNLGVGEAEGQTIILMHSDVVPETPGWLAAVAERLSVLPPSSIVGPKLIDADENLQHAGMSFRPLPNGFWQSMQIFKGYGRDFPPANVEREVPAVTAALMVLRRVDFLAVGGFSTDFVGGKVEGSDLCLKLRSQGGLCLYVPSVTFFHFERQPRSEADRDAASAIYDGALHSLRWSTTIKALVTRTPRVRHAS